MNDIPQEQAMPIRHAIADASAVDLAKALTKPTPQMLAYAVLKFREAPRRNPSIKNSLGLVEMLDVLLAAGAPIESTYSSSSSTLLCEMAGLGQMEIVKRLVGHGALLDGVSTTIAGGPKIGQQRRVHRMPLAMAAYRGHEAVVDTLLDAGCTVDAEDESGQTSLFYAALGGHVSIMERLVAVGANPRHLDHEESSLAHAFLARVKKLSDADFERGVWLLMQWGVDLEQANLVGGSFMESLAGQVSANRFQQAQSALDAHRLGQSVPDPAPQTRSNRL